MLFATENPAGDLRGQSGFSHVRFAPGGQTHPVGFSDCQTGASKLGSVPVVTQMHPPITWHFGHFAAKDITLPPLCCMQFFTPQVRAMIPFHILSFALVGAYRLLDVTAPTNFYLAMCQVKPIQMPEDWRLSRFQEHRSKCDGIPCSVQLATLLHRALSKHSPRHQCTGV